MPSVLSEVLWDSGLRVDQSRQINIDLILIPTFHTALRIRHDHRHLHSLDELFMVGNGVMDVIEKDISFESVVRLVLMQDRETSFVLRAVTSSEVRPKLNSVHKVDGKSTPLLCRTRSQRSSRKSVERMSKI